MSHPTVTIGLPVYNGENYLRQAVDSVLAQTYGDVELVISDNGSTDATETICREYAEQDGRVQYHRVEQNRGATWNFNRVVELARGRYFRWAAHDDLLMPECLARSVEALERTPAAVLAHTAVELIDADGTSRGVFRGDDELRFDDADPATRYRDVLRDHRCFEVFGLIRTEHLRAVGPMGAYGNADGILVSRLALRGPFVKIDDALFAERMHPEQSMSLYNCYTEDEGGRGGPADFHNYASWYDPNNDGKLVFPHWRMLREHVRSITRAPSMPMRQRLRTVGGGLSWLRHKRWYLRRDLAIGARTLWSRLVTRGDAVDRASAVG